jgi:hypothetical protein
MGVKPENNGGPLPAHHLVKPEGTYVYLLNVEKMRWVDLKTKEEEDSECGVKGQLEVTGWDIHLPGER